MSKHLAVAKVEQRAKGQGYTVKLLGDMTMEIFAATYPVASRLWAGPAGHQALRSVFNIPVDDISATQIKESVVSQGPNPSVPQGITWQTEHPIDRSIIARYINTANTGLLQSGAPTRTRPIPNDFWLNVWREGQATLRNLPNVGSGISPDVPSDRVFHATGSTENCRDLILTDSQISGRKGRIFVLRAPTQMDVFQRIADTAARTGVNSDAQVMLHHIRAALAVFNYLRTPGVSVRFKRVRDEIRIQLRIIENNVSGAAGLSSLWDEFTDDYFQSIAAKAQEWLIDAILVARRAFTDTRDANGNPPPNTAEVMAELSGLQSKIQNVALPGV